MIKYEIYGIPRMISPEPQNVRVIAFFLVLFSFQ